MELGHLLGYWPEFIAFVSFSATSLAIMLFASELKSAKGAGSKARAIFNVVLGLIICALSLSLLHW